jgi:hypothetical protein
MSFRNPEPAPDSRRTLSVITAARAANVSFVSSRAPVGDPSQLVQAVQIGCACSAGKRKLGEDAEYVSVVVNMDNNQALEMKFKIEKVDERIGAFGVTLEEPGDCKFGFDLTFEESATAIAHSHGYECLNHGKKVLPRLFVGTVTAVRHKFTQISQIHFSGEAVVNYDQTFDLDAYF